MRGPYVAKGNLRAKLLCFFQFDRFEVFERVLGFVECIKRQRRSVLGALVFVVELRIFLLQVPRVGQKDAAEIDRGRRRINRPAKTFFD